MNVRKENIMDFDELQKRLDNIETALCWAYRNNNDWAIQWLKGLKNKLYNLPDSDTLYGVYND